MYLYIYIYIYRRANGIYIYIYIHIYIYIYIPKSFNLQLMNSLSLLLRISFWYRSQEWIKIEFIKFPFCVNPISMFNLFTLDTFSVSQSRCNRFFFISAHISRIKLCTEYCIISFCIFVCQIVNIHFFVSIFNNIHNFSHVQKNLS